MAEGGATEATSFTPFSSESLRRLGANWSPGLGGRLVTVSRGNNEALKAHEQISLVESGTADYSLFNQASSNERTKTGVSASEWSTEMTNWFKSDYSRNPFFQRFFGFQPDKLSDEQIQQMVQTTRSFFDKSYNQINLDDFVAQVATKYGTIEEFKKDFTSFNDYCKIFGKHSGLAIAQLVGGEIALKQQAATKEMSEKINKLSVEEVHYLEIFGQLAQVKPKANQEVGEKKDLQNYASASDIGGREEQQDFDAVYSEDLPTGIKTISLLADGHGAMGQQVSRLACQMFSNNLDQEMKKNPSISIEEAIKQAVALTDSGVSNQFPDGGTTFVALIQTADKTYIVNVGDSRAYHINQSGISQVTTDHHWPSGDYKYNLMVSRALGDSNEKAQSNGELNANPDIFSLTPAAGDYLLLCCDGVYDVLTNDEIQSLIKGKAPKEAVNDLIAAAKQKNPKDNITANLLKI